MDVGLEYETGFETRRGARRAAGRVSSAPPAPRPGPTPPAPLPPEPKPSQGMFAQRNLRLRIAPEEYCPAWPDDEEEDNPLPGWVEGDSLAPYVGSDPSMLAEALTYAWLTPLDVVCDVGCGDGSCSTRRPAASR